MYGADIEQINDLKKAKDDRKRISKNVCGLIQKIHTPPIT